MGPRPATHAGKTPQQQHQQGTVMPSPQPLNALLVATAFPSGLRRYPSTRDRRFVARFHPRSLSPRKDPGKTPRRVRRRPSAAGGGTRAPGEAWRATAAPAGCVPRTSWSTAGGRRDVGGPRIPTHDSTGGPTEGGSSSPSKTRPMGSFDDLNDSVRDVDLPNAQLSKISFK